MKLTLETIPMYCTACGDCQLWGQGVNGQGYPIACIAGRVVNVRRYILAELMGQAIGQRHRATSRCRNRRCVSPSCLRVTTASEIMRRTYATGARSHVSEYARRLLTAQRLGLTRYTPAEVAAIRAEPAELSDAALARKYGGSRSAVSDIRRGRTWRTGLGGSSVWTWQP